MWVDDFGNVGPAANGQATVELDTTVQNFQTQRGLTIVRIILTLAARPTTAGTEVPHEPFDWIHSIWIWECAGRYRISIYQH